MISHIWFTIGAEQWHGRKIVLRMFWDDEADPSVLTPINDFFAMGHGIEAPLWSLPITTTALGRARNCFFKMPFNQRARIEITNEGLEPIGAFYYAIDYRTYTRALGNVGYFHARYRQEYPAAPAKNYLICSAKGRGHYVGTVLSVESHSEGWWGEGDDRFFVDDERTPSLHGTGTEDYLLDAWGTWRGSSPYYGCSIHEGKPYVYPAATRYTSYRFHIEDPIPFRKSLRVEIEHLGAGVVNGVSTGYTERADNVSSVAYWYQVEPHDPMEPLPPVDERLPDEAQDQKAFLRFLRLAAEDPPTTSIASLREACARLSTQPQYAHQQNLLTARLTRAERTAGNPEQARELLADLVVPFLDKTLLSEIQAMPGLWKTPLGTNAPMLIPWEDGAARRVQKEGRACIATDEDNRKPFCYFALPDESPLHSRDQTVILRITYYSEGLAGDTFRVHYDSFYSEDLAGWYRATEVVTKPSSPGWYTGDLRCPRARLAGHQNGKADFRVSSNEDGDEYLGGIEVVPAPTN